MTKCVWESPAKNRKDEPFLSVMDRDGYYYVQRAGVDSVAFILYNAGAVGLCRCAHGATREVSNRSFTGSIDLEGNWKESISRVVQIEVREEAGYDVTPDQIVLIGWYEVGTQTNEKVYLYIVDVTGLTPGLTQLDSREQEDILGVVWNPTEPTHDWKANLLIDQVRRRY